MSVEHGNPWGGSVSVIVPTHDRVDSLVRLLQALGSDSVTHPHEVIVVADGCSPDTARAVAALDVPYRVRVLEHQPARGAAVARNSGAREASGDVLLFIDDDIEPFGDVVGAHRHHHDGTPRVVIGAPRAPRTAHAGFRELAAWAWWEQQFERMRAPGYRFSYDDVFTGLLSVPRSLWRSVGGFDSSLQCREDYELGLRLVRRRVDFVFSEAGGGWHHENRSGSRLARRKHDEGSADVALARMHPWAFPALRLWTGPADPSAGVVRRVAFDWPRAGAWGARLADRLLDVLEALRMRRAWRRVLGGIMFFTYWRGAASALGSWEALSELRDVAERTRPPDYRELEVDLEDDLELVRSRIDQERPDVLRLRCGRLPLGGIPAAAGREPLRGSHLTCGRDPLGRALIAARALAELRSPAAEEPETTRV